MALPTKASDPVSLLALVIDRLTSRYLEPCVIVSKTEVLAIDFFFLHAFFKIRTSKF